MFRAIAKTIFSSGGPIFLTLDDGSMGCRCNERRTAISKAAVAVAHGAVKVAADQARFVVKSAAEDAASLLRAKVASARMRLLRR